MNLVEPPRLVCTFASESTDKPPLQGGECELRENAKIRQQRTALAEFHYIFTTKSQGQSRNAYHGNRYGNDDAYDDGA